MIHHIILFKLKTEVSDEKLEDMIRSARSQLLKIAEVRNIKTGKKIDPDSEWPFFVAMDFDSMDKLAMCREDSIYMKFVEDVIKPNTVTALSLSYEMEPGKDVRYS